MPFLLDPVGTQPVCRHHAVKRNGAKVEIQINSDMNTYIVSITKEICGEFEIVARSPKQAEFIALRRPSSSQCRMLSDD